MKPPLEFSRDSLKAIDELAEAVNCVSSILCITGAGISADSGLPTYRGIGGLYEDTLTADGVPVEVALSGPMMARNPALTWRYIRQIEEATRGASFNRGHQVLALLEQELEDVWVLTQNVDGFHRQAGSKQVIEIHGNIRELFCPSCRREEFWKEGATLPDLPLCQQCNGVIRPRVVLFEEMLPTMEVSKLERCNRQAFDLVLVIGSTCVFPYISHPLHLALARGAITAEINPGSSEVSDLVQIRIQERAAAVLDALWKRFRGGDQVARLR